ncbi:hypothetical protein [Viridibacillus arvi]|uniref:hypothetical protein n=1 Tax=Viridibacillus arvi TaxID=263475 RepID=UPI003D2BAB22
MLDNNNIERMAVTKINTFIDIPYSHLQSNINVGDKGISFDGTIDIFSSPHQNKTNFLGSVPVQSKGKTVKILSKKNYNFSISSSDINNYFNNDGVLFFCTQLTTTGEAKVFYKMLLPLELKTIIQGLGTKKK